MGLYQYFSYLSFTLYISYFNTSNVYVTVQPIRRGYLKSKVTQNVSQMVYGFILMYGSLNKMYGCLNSLMPSFDKCRSCPNIELLGCYTCSVPAGAYNVSTIYCSIISSTFTFLRLFWLIIISCKLSYCSIDIIVALFQLQILRTSSLSPFLIVVI